MITTIKTGISASALAIAAALSLSACDDKGPAEQLGEQIDESVEKAGDAIEDATD